MRSRRLASIPLIMLGLACAGPEAEPAGVGEPCEQSMDCEASLSCVEGLCESDDDPWLQLTTPAQLDVYEPSNATMSIMFTLLEREAGDRVELTVDPGTADETTVETSLDAPVRGGTYFLVEVPQPASGPHRIRARLVDAEDQPYGDSAEDSAVFFVRDVLVPSAPQVALLQPEPGTKIEAGTEAIEVEVAVLPGSFVFTSFGAECEPVPGCSPAFAPECEDSCGPVSRFGHVKLYAEPDFPACLSDPAPNCATSYIAALVPGSSEVELVDAFVARTMLPVEFLDGPGEIQLSAALSYPSHLLYPNEAEVVHHTITIDVGG